MSQEDAMPVVFCYHKEEWHLWLDDADGSDVFESTWDEWWDNCQDVVQEIEGAGLQPRLVWVRRAEFAEHCRRTGVKNDASSRAKYAAERARREAGASPREEGVTRARSRRRRCP
jgi:hypothetical protein